VLWKQTDEAIGSPGKLVPTGSGSSDADDYRGPGNALNAIQYGMQRELYEECSLKELPQNTRKFVDTKIIGYFRWVNQGGKPEFVGISKLAVPAARLKPDKREVREAVSYDARSLDELEMALTQIMEHPVVPYRYGSTRSVCGMRSGRIQSVGLNSSAFRGRNAPRWRYSANAATGLPPIHKADIAV
jgi:hypothetical protein